MSKFEMIATGVMAYAFVFHAVLVTIAACGKIDHEVTVWCRKAMFVAPTRRMLEIHQDYLIPIIYFVMAATMFHFGWKLPALFTALGAMACIARSFLMRALPARVYKPKQLHPLCHWM